MTKRTSKTLNVRFACNNLDVPDQLTQALKRIQESTSDPTLLSITRNALDHAGFKNHPVRMSPSDHAILVARADDASLTVSEFIRRKVLGKTTRVNVPAPAFDRLKSTIFTVRQRYPHDIQLLEDLMSTLRELGLYEA